MRRSSHINVSFRQWLEEFEQGHFSWVDQMVDKIFQIIQELTRNRLGGDVRAYQGFASKLKESKTSDLHLEDLLSRFSQKVTKDITVSPKTAEPILHQLAGLIQHYYQQRYGPIQTNLAYQQAS